MDTFFEQLIKIKKNAKTWCIYLGIALVAIVFLTAAYLVFKRIFVVLAALIFWGTFKLYSLLEVEYEYIITNSSMDIDKITAKSSRKRIFSFELTEIEKIEKYRKEMPGDIINDAFFACNRDDENVYVLVINQEGKGKKSVVISPNERLREAMVKFLPKYISENLL